MSDTQVETPVEQIYSYQPTDGEGRPIGGKQVIKYTTTKELTDQLEKQNVLLIRKLREQTKKVRLGIEETEDLGENVQHFDGPIEFKPRELTTEENYDIARRLTDPTTSAGATDELLEARLGAPLSLIGSTLQKTQQEVMNLRAKLEANAFVSDNPEYYKCQENFENITSWMVRYNLAPVRENYQKAYDTLKTQGLLVEGPAEAVVGSPVVEPVVEVPVVVDSTVVNNTPPARVPVLGIASGLTNEDASNVGTPVPTGSDITYVLNGQTLTGLAAIAAMPSEEYGRRIRSDREFGKKVDKLESEARKPRG